MTKSGINSRSRPRSELTNFEVLTDVTNASQEQEQAGWESRSDDGPYTVAIVGAGFAGLVLANYLELFHREQMSSGDENHVVPENPLWTYRMFESKSSSGIPVIGTICLESAREVLEELRLFQEACSKEITRPVFPQLSRHENTSTTNSKNDDKYHEVSRESFLELLRKNVKIQSSSRVIDILMEETTIIKSSQKPSRPKYFVMIQDDNGARMKEGPFDLVVASNGLSFRGETTKSMQQKLKSSASIIKIGDSRYRYGRSWWQFDFLGMTRRTSGANTAILDGLKVGRRLLQRDPEGNQIRRDRTFVADTHLASLQNDSSGMLYRDEKAMNLVWMIVAVILVPILLAVLFYN